MLSTRLVSLLSLVLFVRVSDARAQAYERVQSDLDGHFLCRTSRTFVYALSTSVGHPTAAERAAIEAAVNTWRQAASSCSDLVFEQAADVPDRTPTPLDGKTLITFRTVTCADAVPSGDECLRDYACADKYGCWEYAPFDVVWAPLTFRQSTGEIVGARIELNTSKGLLTTVDGPPCAQGTTGPDCVVSDVQSLVTRSIGETLGFALVARTDSTMSRRLDWGDTQKRIIDPGTLEGLCEVYPRGQPTPGCASVNPPDAGTSEEPDAGTSEEPDAGTSEEPDAGTSAQPESPSERGCNAMPSAPLLGALVLLLRTRRSPRRG